MAADDRKREGSDADPERLAQLLELELIQKRAAWQQAAARRGSLRVLSFLFLFIVIVGALIAFFVFFSSDSVTEVRLNSSNGLASSGCIAALGRERSIGYWKLVHELASDDMIVPCGRPLAMCRL